MPGLGAAAAFKLVGAGIGALLTSTTATAIVARLAISTAASYLLSKRGSAPGLSSRGVTMRSTIEGQQRIYGQARVSGPCFWNDAAGPNNSQLWLGVLLAGHEVDSITDIYLDDNYVPNSIINGGAAGGGGVTSGKYAPIGGGAVNVLEVWKHLGTSTDAADSNLVSLFTGWTSAHQLRGLAKMVVMMKLNDETERTFARVPSNYRAIVNGAKVYDPRLDSTRTEITPAGSGSHRDDDPSTWEWSDNPALCVADYLTETRFGLRLDPSRIDWQSVADSADHCEELSDIPGPSTEQRFTCNGTLSGTATHRENLAALCSSMNGEVIVSGGQWYVQAGYYTAPTETVTGDDLRGALALKANAPRGARVNTLRGLFIDKTHSYQPKETPAVFTTALRSRDNDQVLEREVDLPFTDSPYMAQRLLWKALHVEAQERNAVVPFNLKPARLLIGERFNFDVDELGWSPKVFRVRNVKIVDKGDELGADLEIVEDSSSAYADPAIGNYSTVNAAGAITFGDPGVDAPANLTATGDRNGILLEWDNPGGNLWTEAIVYASFTSAWAGASEVWRGRANRWVHQLAAGQRRYYWVRIDDRGTESVRDPDSDTSSVTAVSEAVQWSAQHLWRSEDFGDNNLTRFTNYLAGNYSVAPELSIVAAAAGSIGDYALRLGNNSGNDMYWGALCGETNVVPIVTGRLYRMTIIARQQSGSGAFYAGPFGMAGDVRNGNGTLVNISGADSWSSQHYFAAAGVSLGSGWSRFDVYFTHDGSAYDGSAAGTLDDPKVLHPSVEYVVPGIITNYSAVAGECDIKFCEIVDVSGADFGVMAGRDQVLEGDVDTGAVTARGSAYTASAASFNNTVYQVMQSTTVDIGSGTTGKRIFATFTAEVYILTDGTDDGLINWTVRVSRGGSAVGGSLIGHASPDANDEYRIPITITAEFDAADLVSGNNSFGVEANIATLDQGDVTTAEMTDRRLEIIVTKDN